MAFSPIAFEEFIQLFGWMKGLVVPELIPLVWAPNGDAIGFAYLFPDYSEALRAMKGETGLRARLRFWARRKRPKRLILHTMGAKKEYRRKGLVETFLVGLLREALARGFTRGIGALAKEGPTLYAKTGPAAREYTLYTLE
jgi:hypothetical protein